MSHVVRMILRKEGVRGLWRGTGPTCVRLGLGLGLFFATLDPAMHALAALENTVEEKRRRRRRKGREEGGVGEEEEKGGALGADGRKGGVSGGVTGAGAGAAQFSSRVTFMAAVVSRSLAAAALGMMLLLSLAAAALCPVSVVKTRMEVRGEVNGGTANGVGGGDGFRYTLEVTTNTSGIMLLLSLPAAAAAAALCPVSVVNNTRMEVRGERGEWVRGGRGEWVRGERGEWVRGERGEWERGERGEWVRGERGEWHLLLSPTAAALCLVFVVNTRMEVGGEGGRTGRNKCWRGAAAGALATILTHPPDVVRTHLQLATLRATPGKPLTMLGATSAIYKSQGLPGFFRGVVPRVLKRSMQQALTWTLFERLSSVLSGRTLDTSRRPALDSLLTGRPTLDSLLTGRPALDSLLTGHPTLDSLTRRLTLDSPTLRPALESL
ncbi:unnamed protein product [Closterium sp. Naga37s-1]|nr:unnamed protein product [Closterium sp. Naga37s-1]